MSLDGCAVVLVGGGGHASDVLQAIEAANRGGQRYVVVGILDDEEIDGRRFEGRGVHQLGSIDDLKHIDAQYVVAAGWPAGRRALVARIADAGSPVEAIVHPMADIGTGVELAPGSVVLGQAHLSPMVRLGPHGVVSYGATIGHDSIFGAFASIMPNAAVSGDVVAGDDVLVGTGASILHGLRLGDACQVGAGAAVISDVAPHTTVVGVPAAPVRG